MNWDGKERRSYNPFSQDEKERLFHQVNEIYTMITGGQEPEKGLVYKVRLTTDFMQFWQKFGWIILAGFAGVPCTVIAGIILYIAKGGHGV